MSESISELKSSLKSIAEETIGSIGARFDFGLESIGFLDSLIDGLRIESDMQKQSIANQFGAYIGEVVRRNGYGDWILSQSEPEYPAIGQVIIRSKKSIFDPFHWAHARIENGPEDDILAKFNFFVLNSPRLPEKNPLENKHPENQNTKRGFWGWLFEIP